MQRGANSSPSLPPYGLSPVKQSKPQRWTQDALDSAIQSANAKKEKTINSHPVCSVGHWTQDTLDAEIQRLAETREAHQARLEAEARNGSYQAWTQEDLDRAIQRQCNGGASPSKPLRMVSTTIVPSTNLVKAVSSSAAPTTSKQWSQVALDDALQRLVEERIHEQNRNCQYKGVVGKGLLVPLTSAQSPCSPLAHKSRVRFAASPRSHVQHREVALQTSDKEVHTNTCAPVANGNANRLSAKEVGSSPKLLPARFEERPESPWATSSSTYGAHSSVASSSAASGRTGSPPGARAREAARFRTLALLHSHQ
mmetsp:Transcript_74803/g.117963  ORF Transcript_74803/g.117963 Transcript_74803/m.117963 type:complete len:311 (+) Transcript_74803:47-979(+)